jgi:hypothetical protein
MYLYPIHIPQTERQRKHGENIIGIAITNCVWLQKRVFPFADKGSVLINFNEFQEKVIVEKYS